MTTWNNVPPITTNYTSNAESSSVIYRDIDDPNYQWNSAYNFEQIGYLLMEDGGFLLLQSNGFIEIFSGQETSPILDEWNNVQNINTVWT